MDFKSYVEFNNAKEKCRDCSIGKIYNKVVQSDGNEINPTVMIIGEAPGSEEIIIGRPFVGKAGKLLRSTLNEFGFRKTNSIITNVIPCRPENNKFPKDDNLVEECYKKWLFNEIKILNPKLILLIGSQPLKFVLGFSGITKFRGDWYNSSYNIICLPTFHPSYVLRKEYMSEGPEIVSNFRNDIKKVAQKAGIL